MSAYLGWIKAAIILALLAGIFAFAWNAGGNSVRAEWQAEKLAAAEAYQQKVIELNAVSAELEVTKNEKRIVYRTITKQVDKIITRDVYRNECLDVDGLSSVNAAFAGAHPGKPDATVPAAIAP